MRLRPLSEAECYARCYGGVRTEQVSVIPPPSGGREPEQVHGPEREVPEQLREEAA